MPPRIAHVISTRGIGGAERLLAALVGCGEAHGWRQLVLNPFAGPAAEELGASCAPASFEARACAGPLALPGTRRWLGDRLEAFAPDVVHVMLFHALTVVGTLPRRPGTRRVATNVYGDWPTIAPRGGLVRPVDRWAGRRVDHVIAISQSVRRYLVSSYGYPSSSVSCIPLGWLGTPQPRRSDPERPTIVCVGGLRPEKGHETLLAAMSLVHDRISAARLVVVGDGDRRPALEADVAHRGLERAVEFAGAVPDVWPHLAAADVFASASHAEAFGIGIAEAMAAELPVVAPDVGAIPELVRPGVTGELYPPGDHVALAGHLVRLLEAPDLRARMGTAGRAVAEDLRMEHVVERYFEVFDEMRRRAAGDVQPASGQGDGAGALV
ncbi:MAG: glycosyltransferase family 4 protein [Actinomycetota bacterium]|nr:glycosyltransferase family 4 protein [Actinomycetota bacterium]